MGVQEKDLFEAYVRLSAAYAGRADVQGAGGNSSVKIDHRTLLIKASGMRLGEVGKEQGSVTVAYEDVLKDLNISELPVHDQAAETALGKLISQHTTGQGRASLETLMHIVIPDTYILHTHNVYLNVLLCSEEGRAHLHDLLPMEVVWIPYVAPGLGLGKAIWQILQDHDAQVILLQNHGIIVSGSSAEGVENQYKLITTIVQQFLQHAGAELFVAPEIRTKDTLVEVDLQGVPALSDLMQEGKLVKHLFPDSVVFGQQLLEGQSLFLNDNTLGVMLGSEQKSRTAIENLVALDYIAQIHKKLGRTTTTLPVHEVDYIIAMEQEKYRVNLSSS